VGWLEKYPRLSLAHRPIRARDKSLIAGAFFVDSPGIKSAWQGGLSPPYPRRIALYSPAVSPLPPSHRGVMCR
jgi:hypothetical protein